MEHYLSLFVRAIFIENMALAFFLIGLLIWAIRAVNTEQVEEPDFRIAHHNPAEESA